MRNYLKIAFRVLKRHRSTALINVVGLGIGLAATFLILVYVQDELSYDSYHRDPEALYRITEELLDENDRAVVHRALVDPPIGPLAKLELADVLDSARLTPVGPTLSVDGQHLSCGDCYWGDPGIFRILSFEFLAGDPATALREPFSVVLTSSKARSLFGNSPALGRSVLVNNQDAFQVTGVVADQPSNTHLPLDAVGSMATVDEWFGDTARWGSPNYATYVRLSEGAMPARTAEALGGLLAKRRPVEYTEGSRLHLQPVRDIHLRSGLVGELGANGDIRFVRLFALVGFLILVIACLNFVNLATARSALRAQEVGVRKAGGASRGDLIRQFLVEACLTSFAAVLLAVGIVAQTLPAFNEFAGKSVSLTSNWPLHLLGMVGMALLVGLVAGLYPALYLSRLSPIKALRGEAAHGPSGNRFRGALVVVQFVIAMTLGMSALSVYGQLEYVSEKPLGFTSQNVLVLPTLWEARERFDPVRERLLAHPSIEEVAQSNPIPSRRLFGPIDATPELESGLTTVSLVPVWADGHFFDAYEIPILAGRVYRDESAGDRQTGFVLNQTAVAKLGLDSPGDAVGLPIRVGGWLGEVLGVVEDFHFESLRQEIAPLVFYMDPRNYRMVSIRLTPTADIPSVTEFLRQEWQQVEPGIPIAVSLLEDRLQATYRPEQQSGMLIALFASLALLVTGLGLFGLVSFAAERRMRELSVRRVLGAELSDVLGLMGRGVLALVGIAAILAIPLGYLVSYRWLQGFAYHASIPWWMPLVVTIAAAALALVTVAHQVLKVAKVNPAESLRRE